MQALQVSKASQARTVSPARPELQAIAVVLAQLDHKANLVHLATMDQLVPLVPLVPSVQSANQVNDTSNPVIRCNYLILMYINQANLAQLATMDQLVPLDPSDPLGPPDIPAQPASTVAQDQPDHKVPLALPDNLTKLPLSLTNYLQPR